MENSGFTIEAERLVFVSLTERIEISLSLMDAKSLINLGMAILNKGLEKLKSEVVKN